MLFKAFQSWSHLILLQAASSAHTAFILVPAGSKSTLFDKAAGLQVCGTPTVIPAQGCRMAIQPYLTDARDDCLSDYSGSLGAAQPFLRRGHRTDGVSKTWSSRPCTDEACQQSVQCCAEVTVVGGHTGQSLGIPARVWVIINHR